LAKLKEVDYAPTDEKAVLKCVVIKDHRGVNYVHLAQRRVQWKAVVNW
jgi:hypothetical protein